MRCGASGEPKTGFWSVFQSYRYVNRGFSVDQRPNNFGQAHEKYRFGCPLTLKKVRRLPLNISERAAV